MPSGEDLPDLEDMEYWYQPEGGDFRRPVKEKMPTDDGGPDLPCEGDDLQPEEVTMLDQERMDYLRDRNDWELVSKARTTPMPRWKVIGCLLLIAACFVAVAWVQTPY